MEGRGISHGPFSFPGEPMLRIATLLLVLVSPLAPAAPVPKEKPKEVDPMLGKWKVEEMLVAGRATGKVTKDSGATIDKDKMVFTGNLKEPDDPFGYKLDPDNKKQITLSHMRKPGEFLDFKGIFELDGDSLIVVFALDPKAARPMAAKSGPTVAYVKLLRIKEEKK